MGKRVFDIFFSLVGLFLTAPLFLLVILLFKVENEHPVFFFQKRVGRYGRIFEIIKFRTMEGNSDIKITSSQDRRITKLGKMLRRFKIDELPQFINVIKGEMSIVGPRPEVPEIVEQNKSMFRRIVVFPPGLFSPASLKFIRESDMLDRKDVMQKYLNEILPEKIKCDMDYFIKANIFTDMVIILRSIYRIFS